MIGRMRIPFTRAVLPCQPAFQSTLLALCCAALLACSPKPVPLIESGVPALQTPGDDAAQTLRDFGQRFLGLLYSPNVMAVRRLLVSEGGRSNIGQRCWEMGPARGNAAIKDFLQLGIERQLLRAADTEIMMHQLLALLEAELLPRFVFQHLPAPTPQEIIQISERAVETFMRAYGSKP